MTVMGRDEFDLDLTGKPEGNMPKVAGNIPWGGATVDLQYSLSKVSCQQAPKQLKPA